MVIDYKKFDGTITSMSDDEWHAMGVAITQASCVLRNLLHPDTKPTDHCSPDLAIALRSAVTKYHEVLDECSQKLPSKPAFVYMIWDNTANDFWKSSSGKISWAKSSHAKNALLTGIYGDHTHYLLPGDVVKASANKYRMIDSFDDQKRFECWQMQVSKSQKV